MNKTCADFLKENPMNDECKCDVKFTLDKDFKVFRVFGYSNCEIDTN